VLILPSAYFFYVFYQFYTLYVFLAANLVDNVDNRLIYPTSVTTSWLPPNTDRTSVTTSWLPPNTDRTSVTALRDVARVVRVWRVACGVWRVWGKRFIGSGKPLLSAFSH